MVIFNMGNTCGCLRAENTCYRDEGTMEFQPNGSPQDHRKAGSRVHSEQEEIFPGLNLDVGAKIGLQSLVRGYLLRKDLRVTMKLQTKSGVTLFERYLEECSKRTADLHLGSLRIEPEGLLTCDLENGSVYQGLASSHNSPEGKGLELTKDETFKIGEYRKGKLQNLGRCLFADGSMFQGTFLEGIPSGFGVFIDVDGSKYEGHFENGLLTAGRKTYKDGAIYDGAFKDRKRDGNGRMGWTNSDCYVGEFVNDLRHGQGRMVWNDSNIYEGEWKLDSITGFGEFQYANGDIYEGDLINGIRHGKGCLIMANGVVHECQWKDGKEDGEGSIIIIRENDDIVNQAVWKEGVRLTTIKI